MQNEYSTPVKPRTFTCPGAPKKIKIPAKKNHKVIPFILNDNVDKTSDGTPIVAIVK